MKKIECKLAFYQKNISRNYWLSVKESFLTIPAYSFKLQTDSSENIRAMILTTHAELLQYVALNTNFADAIEWADQADWNNLAEGKHNIDGERLFLINETVTLQPLGPESVWEAHNRYVDILLILEGTERIGWAPRTNELPLRNAYNEATDKVLFEASDFSGTMIDVEAGQAVIMFPSDAHVPCLAIDGPKQVKRAVFKVRVDH